MTYSPEMLVLTVRVKPVASLVAVTLAPLIAAPPGSVTNPRKEAVVTCAWEITAARATTKKVEDKIRKYLIIIFVPPEFMSGMYSGYVSAAADGGDETLYNSLPAGFSDQAGGLRPSIAIKMTEAIEQAAINLIAAS